MADSALGRKRSWNQVKRIDFHTHLIPRHWPDFSRRYGYGGFVHIQHDENDSFTTVGANDTVTARLMLDGEEVARFGANAWDMTARVRDMDAAGVDVQVVSTIPELFSYWAKDDDASDLARILNNDMKEAVALFPDRFIGLGTVPLQAPELAVAELTRCMRELGFAGVIVGTHVNEWNLDAPELTAFWEAAEELGAVVFVHPNNQEAKNRETDRFLLPKLVGQPAEICHALSCVLIGEILNQFPRLQICFAYGGGTFPFVRAQIEQGLRNAGVKGCERAESLTFESWQGRFFCDSLMGSHEATKFLVKVISEDMVVFGSDYPFPLGSSATKEYSLNKDAQFPLLSEDAFNKIAAHNSSRIFNRNDSA